MYTQTKTVLKWTALLFLVLFPSLHVWAQPFGILSPQGQQESQKQILSSPNGRFVFGQISDSGKDQFMLDTLTGRLWRIAERGDIGMHLTSIPYCNSEGECSPLPEDITISRQKKGKKP